MSLKSEHSMSNRALRGLWGWVWLFFFRLTPRTLHGWRCWVLRAFGARIGRRVLVYNSARIWAPWNLHMDDGSAMGEHVDCYCVAPVHIGREAIVSQYTYLCAATHDYRSAHFPLVTAPIRIGERAWVAADVFIGPGVTVGEGAVVGARASVFKTVEPWTVVGGNPARLIKQRERPATAS